MLRLLIEEDSPGEPAARPVRRVGPLRRWVKVKNPDAPAAARNINGEWRGHRNPGYQHRTMVTLALSPLDPGMVAVSELQPRRSGGKTWAEASP